MSATPPDCELLDVGDGRRLDLFGTRIVDRPAQAAVDQKRTLKTWTADLRFDRTGGWITKVAPWTIDFEGLTLELRTAAGGQVGLFPEQAQLLPWLREQVGGPMSVLNLFAYSGLATLGLARAGAAVAHVDASRPAVNWARRNAELSGLADRSIRWLVDDALGFVNREARRGRRYDGAILDPPSYGHAGRTNWTLEHDLPALLAAVATVLSAEAFVLLTSHTPAFGPERLAAALEAAFGRRRVESGELALEARSGARLELGAFARFAR